MHIMEDTSLTLIYTLLQVEDHLQTSGRPGTVEPGQCVVNRTVSKLYLTLNLGSGPFGL